MEQKTKKVRVLKCACGQHELSGKVKHHVEYLNGHIRRNHYRDHRRERCIENWPRFTVLANG